MVARCPVSRFTTRVVAHADASSSNTVSPRSLMSTSLFNTHSSPEKTPYGSHLFKVPTHDASSFQGSLDLLINDERRMPTPGFEDAGISDLGFINAQTRNDLILTHTLQPTVFRRVVPSFRAGCVIDAANRPCNYKEMIGLALPLHVNGEELSLARSHLPKYSRCPFTQYWS